MLDSWALCDVLRHSKIHKIIDEKYAVSQPRIFHQSNPNWDYSFETVFFCLFFPLTRAPNRLSTLRARQQQQGQPKPHSCLSLASMQLAPLGRDRTRPGAEFPPASLVPPCAECTHDEHRNRTKLYMFHSVTLVPSLPIVNIQIEETMLQIEAQFLGLGCSIVGEIGGRVTL